MADQRFVFRDGTRTLELPNIADIVGFGLPPVELGAVERGWRRDGQMIQWTRYDARPFSIQFDVSAMTYEDAAATRRAILAFFAGKRPITLECTRFDGLVLTLTDIHLAAPSAHVMHQIPFLQETLQFIAGNPFFTRAIPMSSVLLEVALLEWPDMDGLEWVENGIEFSSAENEITVNNNGDVDADALIQFMGPATTPYIKNTTTGTLIKVNRDLGEDDILEYDSATGRVDIIAEGGTRNNAYNFLTDDSGILRYVPGVNRLEFGSAGGGGRIRAGGTEYYASL